MEGLAVMITEHTIKAYTLSVISVVGYDGCLLNNNINTKNPQRKVD